MKKGFTLVELLLVMGLMAIMLVTVSVISIQGTLKKSNDQKRIADLEQIRTALEKYKSNDPNRNYPPAISSLFLNSYLAPNYIDSVPHDPKPLTYSYYYLGSGSTYLLCAYMENAANSNGTCNANSCLSHNCNYGVTNP